MLQFGRNWWWEILGVLAFGVLAGIQLFTVPITGLADNGDFPKVLGHLEVCTPTTGDRLYIYSVYQLDTPTDPKCEWDSHMVSSEGALVRIIGNAVRWNERNHFSIQAAGKAHLTVLLVALAILLWSLHDLRPLLRFGLPPLILLIFGDVAYVGYLNSFYMDAASMVFLLLTMSLAVAAVLRPRTWIAIGYLVAAVFFILSKSQHAVLGPLVAGFAVWLALRGGKREARLWGLAAVAAMVATVAMFHLTDEEYRLYPLYNLIFYQLTPHSREPADTLAELGLPSSDFKLVGTHSYSPNTSTSDDKWVAQFRKRTSYLKLAMYYANHPEIPLEMLWTTLRDSAAWIRTPDLGNYRREDGFPPGALADRFNWWSRLRSRLFVVFPAHMVIFYVLMGGFALAGCWRRGLRAQWPLAPLTVGLVIAGVMEFTAAALLDCLETARHLFIFHVLTEMLIVCAVAGALSLVKPRATLGSPL